MTSGFDIEITRDWTAFAPRWAALAATSRASPFQTSFWLTAWFEAFTKTAGIRPLLVAVRDRASGADVLLLPLVERRSGALRIVEFADLDVTDCNAAAIAPALLADADAAAVAIDDVRRALPPCDVLRLVKMPASIGEHVNPLTAAPADRPFMTSGNRAWSIHTAGGWDDYLHDLDRYTRKELGRSRRLCEQMGPTRLVRARTADEARAILDVVDGLQRERLAQTHARHVFDTPASRDFYGTLVERGVAGGDALAVGLEIGGETVAGVVGVLDRPRVTVLRIANRAGPYARIGLGRLLLAETFRELHGDGYTHFDMSIGDGEHKRRLGATPQPLHDRLEAMSWRGGTAIAASRGKALVKQRLPRLAGLAGRLRRRAMTTD